MNKEEFMKELEYLLQDIPEEEKEDALEYYRDYLEEAGEEEEQVLREFGSPERIAAMIRADIAGHLENGGEFTDHGYEDTRFRDPNYQVAKRYDLPESCQGNTKKHGSGNDQNPGNDPYHKRKTEEQKETPWLKIVLGGILLLIGAPVLLGIGGGLLGLITALLGTLLAAVVGVGLLTVVMFLGGVVCIGAGIAAAISGVGVGILSIGVGTVILGFSILGFVVCVLFYGKFLPWLFRTVIDIIHSLVHRKGSRS